MQEPHDRDDHHPARLIRIGLAAALALTLVCAGAARADRLVSLPSPLAPLSAEPPLSGGAAASSENVRHRIAATTNVRVAVDRSGTPFAVSAVQRLDLRVLGDYFFTVGAPLRNVVAGPGSASTPGFRAGSIIWAGFNPGHRVLIADAMLELRPAAATLPLELHVTAAGVVLENTTGVEADAFSADAPPAPLLAYMRQLAAAVARDRVPVLGTVSVTSTPERARVHVSVPLHVTGTVGTKRVDLVLTGRTTIRANGPVDLRVEPFVHVAATGLDHLGGRALLATAIRTTLVVARERQYASYLGNPDPTGTSRTTFVYRTAERVVLRPLPGPASGGRSWTTSLLILAGIAAALVAGAVVWARS